MASPEEEFAEAMAFFTKSVNHAQAAIIHRMDHIEAGLARSDPFYRPWVMPDKMRLELEAALADAPAPATTRRFEEDGA